MNIKQKLFKLYHIFSTSIQNLIDVRDIFLFSGLFILSYGLWLLAPWIGFSVGGFLLMILGLLMKGK